MILQVILIALIGSAFCQQEASNEITRAQELMERLPAPPGYTDYWFSVNPQVFEGLGTAPKGYLRVLKRIH
ncbi:hypothetical protein PV327_002107 [Microctonus hyperodae]|uniref:Uncharacterized protein n=1 Tax=Microctonus hyperodae TaxID=165561 RepID=A0AA39FF15_MICHY|nr:hypothetical protein PV327_002107 [Microctonus hyperodae]